MIARPRLVVCDLDGTLVDSDKRLRPTTIAAVDEAAVGIAVISARPRSGVMLSCCRPRDDGDDILEWK